MERLDQDECPGRGWRVIQGGGAPVSASAAASAAAPKSAPISEDAARPVPEDYGLTPADLRIWYAPGRVGALLALAATAGMAALEAWSGLRSADGWVLGVLGGLLYGALFGGFAGLGLMVLVHWCDPLVGMAWPAYARLRRYREDLAAARAAERGNEGYGA